MSIVEHHRSAGVADILSRNCVQSTGVRTHAAVIWAGQCSKSSGTSGGCGLGLARNLSPRPATPPPAQQVEVFACSHRTRQSALCSLFFCYGMSVPLCVCVCACVRVFMSRVSIDCRSALCRVPEWQTANAKPGPCRCPVQCACCFDLPRPRGVSGSPSPGLQ